MSRLRRFATTFKDLARLSTIHGLLHIFQSNNRLRRCFWVVLLLAAFTIGVFHTVKTVKKFMDNPVAPQLKLMAETAVFPAITICNLKPTSEKLGSRRFLWNAYINAEWGNFSKWFPDERVRLPDEDMNSYMKRQQELLRRLLHVMWVSVDTRDIGHSDQTMILSCKFNGRKCDEQHFSLVQNFRYWNCYRFDKLKNETVRHGARGDELDIVAFTDSYETQHSGQVADYNESMNISVVEYLLKTSCLNKLLMLDRYESAGLRLFIHEDQDYPLFSQDFVNVQPGRSSVINLSPVKHKLISNVDRKCSEPQQVRYVRFFPPNGSLDNTQSFRKRHNDYVVEEKQRIIYDNCGCYSHWFPFHVNISELCYFKTKSGVYPLAPDEAVVHRIRCHDTWLKNLISRGTEMQKESGDKKLCEFVRYRPAMQSIKWPKPEDTEDIWDDLIVPKIKTGVEFLAADKKKHYMFNFSASHINGSHFKASREEFLFMYLILSEKRCREHICGESALTYKHCNITKLRDTFNRWSSGVHVCITKSALKKNVARISIRVPHMADVYEEKLSFEWTEALSRIGGVFGLWLGASFLVVFELVEFVCMLCVSCLKGNKTQRRQTMEIPMD